MREHLLRNSVFLRLKTFSFWVACLSTNMNPASSAPVSAASRQQSNSNSTTHTGASDHSTGELNSHTDSTATLPTIASSGSVQKKSVSESAAKRRARPPLSYTDDFETPELVTFRPIGVVRSPYKVCSQRKTCSHTYATVCLNVDLGHTELQLSILFY